MPDKAGSPDGKFGKGRRLLKTGDFRLVYRKGRSVKSGPFVLCYLAAQRPHSRIGFSIPSRSVKLASRRNRIRRLFREAYRRNSTAIATPCDLVLVVKREPQESMTYEDAAKTIQKLFVLAGICA